MTGERAVLEAVSLPFAPTHSFISLASSRGIKGHDCQGVPWVMDCMRDEHTDERTDNRKQGFRLELNVQPLADLLDGLLGGHARRERGSRKSLGRRPAGRIRRATSNQDHTGTRTADDCLVDARIGDDELVVVADVPRASADELRAGIDRRANDLVVGRDGDVLERVDIPWESVESADATLNNDVLEVRVRQAND